MQKILCFSGQLQNGKDECADYVAFKIGWKRMAFANTVKKVFCDSFGVSIEFVEKWKRIAEPPPGMKKNVRQSLQFIGDGFREIQGDIWIQIALREKGDLIVSDGRYFNEAKAVQEKGGLNVLVYRPGFLNQDPNLSEAQIRPLIEWCTKTQVDGKIKKGIEGEPEVINFYDYFIINDGSLSDLYSKLDKFLLTNPYFS